MKRSGYAQSADTVDINLSPLIDMMFLLLIFFIVTTAFVEEVGVDIQKPKASTAESLEKKSIMLGVTPEGRVIYGAKEIGLNNVRGVVARLLKSEQRPVIILADIESKSGIVVSVIDECRAAGAKQVSIATSKE